MTQHTGNLRQIVVKTAENRLKGFRSLAVFDLDSTLFDVGPRLQRILADFARVPEYQARFPEQVSHFEKLKVEKRDWGIRDALIRAGLDGLHPEFQEEMKNFWKKHFFSNEYLIYDKPYPGAEAFVKSLHAEGAEIVYLTGRDVARMGRGSAEVLEKWGFPLNETARLELKPHRSMDDAAFKTDWFLALPDQAYADVWFFENEPVNINHMRLRTKKVEILFFDSTHSRRENPPEDLPRIMHFLLDDDDGN